MKFTQKEHEGNKMAQLLKQYDIALSSAEQETRLPEKTTSQLVSTCASPQSDSDEPSETVHKTLKHQNGNSRKPSFHTLRSNDIKIGEKLGEGGFCEVHQVTIFHGETQHKPLAIKFLRRAVLDNKLLYERGAADLAREARFLAELDHKNIIRLRGISDPEEKIFFLVMDRLYDTLDDRMNLWRQGISLARQEQHGLFTLFRKKEDPNEKRLEDLKERLKVALEIADALEYLHSLNILHRDIKPDNIGFDIDGNIQLIDFGLAKELKESDKNINGKYELTGNTGVWCYMAPEVAKGWAYDKTVDVYSFGILLWEICALERPFSQYTKEEHTNVVVNGDNRLDIASWWPVELQWLLKICWTFFPSGRPTFVDIRDILEEIIQEKKSGDYDESVARVGFSSLRTWRRNKTNDDSNTHDLREAKSTRRSHR